MYNTTTKFTFDELNLPINFYQQREQEFRKYRKEKLPFMNFEYDEMEGTVYDFKIGNFRVQEKVTKMGNDNRYHFCICKNDSDKRCSGGQKFKQYDIGDNDFYWLNCDDKKIFFVIPEKILIERGFIGNKLDKNPIQLKVCITNPLHKPENG